MLAGRKTAGNWSTVVLGGSVCKFLTGDLLPKSEPIDNGSGTARRGIGSGRDSLLSAHTIETGGWVTGVLDVSHGCSPTYIHIYRIGRFFFRGCVTRFALCRVTRSLYICMFRRKDPLNDRNRGSFHCQLYRLTFIALLSLKRQRDKSRISDFNEFRRRHKATEKMYRRH